ncbi:hypothetical protein ACTFIR_000025 [Dictyostelium discoideum]
MSLVLPIPSGTNSSLLENDLGRGFSIDENGGNAIKNSVFICEKENINSTFPKTDLNNFTLIKSCESLKSALNVGGEIGLSFGLLYGKVMGSYMETNITNNETMTFLYSRRVVDKIVELDYHAKPSNDIINEKDIDSLRSKYGLYYISKIEYGSFIDVKITLDSSDHLTMKKLKGEFEAGVNFGLFKISVKYHIEESDSSSFSRINSTSSIVWGGCEPIDNQNNIQSFDDVMKIIDSFKVDPNKLVPIRIEISPIPQRVTTILSNNSMYLNQYKNKISSIGSFYWEIEQMIIQLQSFNKILNDNNKDQQQQQLIYLNELSKGVDEQIKSLKNVQDSLTKFIQSSMKYILNKDIPYTESTIFQLKLSTQQIIGSTFTETDKGRWIGPTVNNKPIYKGIYKYKDGSKYEGLCLDGKRHGNGKLTYRDGNIDQLISIDGKWDNDEVSFPSTIIYKDKSECKILDLKSLGEWKERLNKIKISNSLEFSNFSKESDEFVFKYFVNVDLIEDDSFKDFYRNLVLFSSFDDDHQRFNFILLGMTGVGKTTMIELFLNIITGQVNDDPKQLRATNLENKDDIIGVGKSKTKSVCRYDIEYHSENTWMFGITIIDTPGFIDSKDLNKDGRQHIKSILSSVVVNKLERIDSVSLVFNAELIGKIKEQSTLFSTLLNDTLECLSTIITFSDKKNQINQVINEMIDNIKDKPAIFIDNPWSKHPHNKFKEIEDNTETLQKIMKEKTKIIQEFFIDRIKLKSSFKP